MYRTEENMKFSRQEKKLGALLKQDSSTDVLIPVFWKLSERLFYKEPLDVISRY